MKRVSLIGAEVLLLFLGVVAPSYARQDQHEEGSRAPKQDQQAKPERQQQATPEEQKQAKPQVQQQKPRQQAAPAKQEQRQQPKARPEQAKSNGGQQEQQKQAKTQQAETKQNDQQKQRQANNQQARTSQRSASSRPPQRTQEEQTRQRAEPSLRLSAMGKSRIPDARFRSNFGRTHQFRIGSPKMVGGYSRFQYGGYWFGFVQPWPANWYYTDDVYVDYINGQYYLCNPYYPGVNVAISVVM